MDSPLRANDPNSPLRQCGSCTLCCKLLEVTALDKPRGSWCGQCKVGAGCNRYDTRPSECRDFTCGFLTLPDLDESWRPSTAKLLIAFENGDTKAMFIHVDPARPDAWKRAPYYPKLKEWARRAVAGRGQVIVKIGLRAIVVLPHRDVDLGHVDEDEMIVTRERRSVDGIELDAIKMRRDDPQAAFVISPQHRSGIALG